jgi:hypothetical protein
MSNRDRIDRAMAYLASGLGPVVSERMTAAFPGGGDWIKALMARNPSRYSAGHRYSLSDPRFLLRIVTEEWRTFRDQLSRVEQGYAAELREAGNRWAHQDPFSVDDTYRTLDTMERLLTAVGAAEQAAEVRSLRGDLQQPELGATASAGSPPPRPAPMSANRSGRPPVAFSRVTRADVLRAVEEYDRLGQDRFLAEHGFGRATAYLLIHGGRSYDSKAILGVAYKLATGIPIGSQDFSGGVSGAAGVLRRLGFEIHSTRDSASERPDDRAAAARPVVSDFPAAHGGGAQQRPISGLEGIDPRRSLIVLTCSGRKESGGRPPTAADASAWPQDLLEARVRVLATAQANTGRVLPAWRRYTGTFYQHARPAVGEAATTGHVVIISGGYGIIRADEPIAWYDKVLQLSDWPPGLLESALVSEAERCGAQTVVAFASATTGYAKLLHRTPWRQAGIDARLVTVVGVTGGAMSEVPRRLGQAFSAFWNRQHSSYPAGMRVELLG